MRPRVLSAELASWCDPADVVHAIIGDAPLAFWLDSGASATTGWSYLGTASDSLVGGAEVLDALRDDLAERAIDHDPLLPDFTLGWIGWLGYELRAATMGMALAHRSRYPDAAFLRADRVVAFDHARRRIVLLALADGTSDLWLGELADWRSAVEAALEGRRAERTAFPEPPAATARASTSDADYLELIARCQEHIRAGDAYQLCLTNSIEVDARPDPLETYLRVRASSPTHHGALILVDGIALVSASPERFLSVSPAGIIESKPIKGTRPRGATPAEDAALVEQLVGSDKERAENLMIVDLMRNDIGRVSRVGSVSVPSLLAVESYAHVHQLVSTVRGELADGLVGLDAVVASFPAGSMTGAPKRRAIELLDELEQRARGIYSGAFGYLGLDGAIDLAMVIRSIVIDASGCTIGTGGGITTLSVPREELAETKLKAAALLRVLGAAPPQ